MGENHFYDYYPDFVNLIKAEFTYSQIFIVSNGLLILAQNKRFESIRDKVTVQISQYLPAKNWIRIFLINVGEA